MSFMRDTPLRNPEQLGAAIRLKRKEKGLSQSAFAELLGVERKWVIRLEAGNSGAELGLVIKALELVGIQALLRDPERKTKAHRVAASRLDEVFTRLQRRK
jgi:transcriptional regulator with XRE-family HTH domain